MFKYLLVNATYLLSSRNTLYLLRLDFSFSYTKEHQKNTNMSSYHTLNILKCVLLMAAKCAVLLVEVTSKEWSHEESRPNVYSSFTRSFQLTILKFNHVRCLLKSPCGMKPFPIGKHLPHISPWSSSLSEGSLYWPSITSNVALSSIRIAREYYYDREGKSPTRVRPREFL